MASLLLFGPTAIAPVLGQTDLIPAAPSPENATSGVGLHTLMQIQVETERAFSRLAERSATPYTIIVRDASVEGTQAYAAGVTVSCQAVNQTADAHGWGFSTSAIPYVAHGQEVRAEFRIFTSSRPSPEFFFIDFSCSAGAPINDVVGNFTLSAQVEEYVYMGFSTVNTISKVRPDQEVDFVVRVTNSGSHVKRFFGKVDAPDGWLIPTPPAVVLAPGESREITITGIAPRDQLFYLSSSGSVLVTYFPDGDPGKGRTVFFPVTLKGAYLHPALVPLTLLTIVLVGVLVFFAVLARRAVEEQILGKPVPPWRIPAERALLRQLMRDDSDEFYIVRYYLMVEEHQSALLWFAAFKQATKKDRKRESKWFKTNRKQERKVIQLRKAHQKRGLKWERAVSLPEKKAQRKLRSLERKLRRKERKEQRKINRKHRKLAKTIDKKHQKKVKKTLAKFEKRRSRDLVKSEKANKKRIKKGEQPLPLPDPEAPVFEDPVLPEIEQVSEVPLETSRYEKRVVRVHARAKKLRTRVELRRDGDLAKDARRVDAKSVKLRSKIPPEPKTTLYSEDEYVPEDEIIVEDDRSAVARWLALPTLEEREQARRRSQIHRANIRKAKDAGHVAEAESLRQEFMASRQRRAQERREAIKAGLAQRKEARRLESERQRRLKARAKEIKAEAGPAADKRSATDALRVGLPAGDASEQSSSRFKLKKRRAQRESAKESAVEPEVESRDE